ncbi:hypothetical protein ANRL1_01424 [Anaerolineae bacterium]|nr:hypothetical protein ANRL1_01424 [Anaerolineae bacterium]
MINLTGKIALVTGASRGIVVFHSQGVFISRWACGGIGGQ